MKILFTAFLLAQSALVVAGHNSAYQDHYLVGLLNYPNSDVPAIFQNHTSGTYVDPEKSPFEPLPYKNIPLVGFSDIEPAFDADGTKVLGEYFCLSDNGYGNAENSADYPLNIQRLKIQKPFTYRHGESTFEKYTKATNLNTALIRDPNNLVQWENGADIQVTYHIPDETWDEFKSLRVLTGSDFDVEGMVVLNQNCAMVGEEFMPSVFMVNPSTGEVLSNFVRTPDIDAAKGGSFNGKFLSSTMDKVHCTITDLESNACKSVDSSVVEQSKYRKTDKGGGFEGMALLEDGTVAAFLEKTGGDTTLSDEPGVRVYKIKPGDCSSGSAPVFDSFVGFYPFEHGASSIADVSSIPGTSEYVAVIERNGFPKGHLFPAPTMPANRVCIVNLLDVDENMVLQNKKCVLNYHNIDDPWDVDNNGIFKFALTQVTSEALIVVDDYCILAGTDTNYPEVNQFGLDPKDVPDWQKVSDTRFMVVCFVEPIFSGQFLEQLMTMKEIPIFETSATVKSNNNGQALRSSSAAARGGNSKVISAILSLLAVALFVA